MDLGLSGKRCLVTGGTRGIGRATLDLLLAEGAQVATCARGAEGVSALQAAHGGSVHAEALDVRDGAAMQAWFERSVERMGGLDIVVSNVTTRVTTEGDGRWAETFEVDFHQHVRLAQLALPHLEQSGNGCLLFVSSIASVLSQLPPQEDAYGAMKAALVNYAAQLAQTYGRKNVRVNLVSPGPITFEGGFWDMVRQRMPQMFETAAQRAAVGRHGTPDEVASALVFLASPRSGFTTGANLRIDGGLAKTANF